MKKVWMKIGESIRLRQRKCADWLQKQSSKISRKSFITIFLLFCLGFGSACGYVIYSAWHSPPQAFKIGRIKKPKSLQSTPEKMPLCLQPRQFLERIKQLPEGTGFYDSLMQARPGLMDSLERIEKKYYRK